MKILIITLFTYFLFACGNGANITDEMPTDTKWKVHHEKNPMTDNDVVVAELSGNDGNRLVLRCSDIQKSNVYDIEIYILFKFIVDNVNENIRFDEQEEFEITTIHSTNAKGKFIKSSGVFSSNMGKDDFLDNLKNSSTLIVKSQEYQSGIHYTKFDTSNSISIVNLIRTTCDK